MFNIPWFTNDCLSSIALVIHGPKNVPYDKDLGPVLLTDWYHDEYFNIVEKVMSSPVKYSISNSMNMTNI